MESEKKKRGRPRLFRPEIEKAMRDAGRQYVDTRTLQNEDYESRACSVLELSPENPPDFPFRWLADNSRVQVGASKRRGYRKTILAELGRIKSDADLVEAASEICRLKPKTKDAVKLIRGWRLGSQPEEPSLESAVRKTVEDYRIQHPEISLQDIQRLFETMAEEYEEKILSYLFNANS